MLVILSSPLFFTIVSDVAAPIAPVSVQQCVLGFSHDNNSMTYTSAELVSLLRVLVRYYSYDDKYTFHGKPRPSLWRWIAPADSSRIGRHF